MKIKRYLPGVLSKNLPLPFRDNKNEKRSLSDRAIWRLLFTLAIGLRFIYIWQSRSNPLFGYPVVDASVYESWANQMANGQWLWYYVYNYLPVYPAFLSLQKIFLGNSPWINKLLQSLMGALAVVLMAQVARTIWNRRVGVVTGILLATNWMLIVFESEKYAESTSIFFLCLTLWLLICKKHKPSVLLVAGVCLALSAGCRANLFLLWPFIITWLLFIHRKDRKQAWQNGVLFALGVVLLIGPIVYRNYQLTGAPMLRAQAGWSFYSAVDPRFGGLHPPAGAKFMKEIRRPFHDGLRNPVSLDRFWFERAWSLIRDNTGKVIINQLHRLIIFCNARQWSQEFDVYAYRNYSNILRFIGPVFWLLIPLGLLGLIQTRNYKLTQKQWLLLFCLLLSIASIFPFKVSDRYRLPTLVLLTPLAAYAACRIAELIQRRQWRHLLRIGLVLAGLMLLCWPDWANLEARKTARHDYFSGLAYQDTGREHKAIRAYQKSMNRFSWDPDAPYAIARILISQGRLTTAKYYLQTALDREPVFPEALLEMAYIAFLKNDTNQAESYLLKSLNQHPRYMDALLFATRLYKKTGNIHKERFYYQKALTESHFPSVREGRFADIAMDWGLRLEELGQAEAAIDQLETVLANKVIRGEKKVEAALIAGSIQARNKATQYAAFDYWEAVLDGCPPRSFPWYLASLMMGTVSPSTVENYLETHPDNEQQVFGFYLLGLQYQRAGQLDQAHRAFSKSLRPDPSDLSPLFTAGKHWAEEALSDL